MKIKVKKVDRSYIYIASEQGTEGVCTDYRLAVSVVLKYLRVINKI